MTLKFEGKFKRGDVIKAFDFYPPHKNAEADSFHFIGTVIATDFVHPIEGWRGLEAVCTKDNGHGGHLPEYTRVGAIIRVPYGMMRDDDEDCVDRIQLAKGEK